MSDIGRRHFLAIGAGALVAGCDVPRGAARENEILKSAEKDTLSGYAIYPVSRAFLPQAALWPVTGSGPRGDWIARQKGAQHQIIAPGDKVNLVIWDSEDNSLLTAPEQKAVRMEGMTVAPDGTIFVPYVEAIRISGMTPEAARSQVQEKMEAIIPSAQVQLSLDTGRQNSVDLVGGVASPGSYPLVDRDMTVLNLIAMGGGVASGLQNPLIRLIRNGTLYVTTVSRLYADPALDTTLRGGDKVIVEEDPRRFLALGAAGREQLVPFPKDDVTALDAMALIGGVSDARADPKGVLILREYPPSATRAGVQGPRETRVIFTIDLTTADGLFSAGKFGVNPDDLVYVSESPLNTIDTISRILGNILGAGARVNNVTN
jgi:polysaccharide biosynthesis/export protein